MYQLGDTFSFDEEYKDRAEFCNKNNFEIKKIGDNLYKIVESGKDYTIEKRIENLKIWFDNEYTKQEQKLRRLYTLGLKTDNGEDAKEQLILLYKKAEDLRKQIQELEKELKDIE